jgi:hypothetical protein
MGNEKWLGKKCRFCGDPVSHSENVERKALALIERMGSEAKEEAFGLLLDNCDRCLPVNAFIRLGVLTEEEGRRRCLRLRDEVRRLFALMKTGGMSRKEYVETVNKMRKQAFLIADGVRN